MGGGARLAVAAVCLLLTATAAPGPASAAWGGFHRLVKGKVPEPVLTDGRRWAAYPVTGRRTRVVDDGSGTVYTVDTPSGCSLAAVGHGVLMWQCYEPRGAYPVLFDMRDRHLLPVAGIEAMFDDIDRQVREGSGPEQPAPPHDIWLQQVGQHWVGGLLYIDYGYHAETYRAFALNWRTGELRYDRPAKARAVPDFESPELGRPMCSPLRRVRDDTVEQRIFREYAYERPYGVRGGLTSLLLERCGRPTRVLARCGFQTGCTDTFQLGAGMVTWATHRRAFLYDLRRGLRLTFSQPGFRERGPEDTGNALRPQHTRRTVFVSVPIVGAPGPYIEVRWRLYSRRIPAAG
jgi:hypothetical protein